MLRVGAIVPDGIGGVDLDGEDALCKYQSDVVFRRVHVLTYGAHDATEDLIAGGFAWGVECTLGDGMGPREMELDHVANSSGEAVWVENITSSTDSNSVGGSERAGDECRSGSKGFNVNHLDGL
jgi:hypothetical protein